MPNSKPHNSHKAKPPGVQFPAASEDLVSEGFVVPSVARDRPLVKPTLPIGVAPQATGAQRPLGNTGITFPASVMGGPDGASAGALDVPVFAASGGAISRPTVIDTTGSIEAARLAKARAARAERWHYRHELRDFTTLQSVKHCGIAPIPHFDGEGNRISEVTLRVKTPESGPRSAGYGGLQHCGSVWGCPVCSAMVATERAGEIKHVLGWALREGYQASFLTLTLQHFKGQRLKQVWSAVSKGWNAAIGGRSWMAEQQEYGIEGWVKAVEATHGENGWHVHLHVLLIWSQSGGAPRLALQAGQAEDGAIRELAEVMHERWTRGVQKQGFDSWRDSGGMDLRRASLKPQDNGLHQYFTKMAFEMAGGYAKQAKGKGRAPFQILHDALSMGLVDDFELWREWEEGSKRRRQIAWSDDIRERAGLGKEKSDEEIANETMAADEAITLGPTAAARVLSNPALALELLTVTEDGGLDAGCRWLDERGFWWTNRRDVESRPPPGQMVGQQSLPLVAQSA